MPDDNIIPFPAPDNVDTASQLNFLTAPGDPSWRCALALCLLGRGWSYDNYPGETQSDYASKCTAAEHVLIKADDEDVIDAVKRLSAGPTVTLGGRAIRKLASKVLVTETMGGWPP